MKKNRPGVMISALCEETKIATLEDILFRETATLGIRRYSVARHKLARESVVVASRFGPIRGKIASIDGRPPVFSPEHDDCAALRSNATCRSAKSTTRFSPTTPADKLTWFCQNMRMSMFILMNILTKIHMNINTKFNILWISTVLIYRGECREGLCFVAGARRPAAMGTPMELAA